MSADQLENELIRKVAELQQEAKEHQLVLDAFKSVEPDRRCYRLIGGVLIEKTVKEVKPSLEENLLNVCTYNRLSATISQIDKAIGNLNETIRKRREERTQTHSGDGHAKTEERAPATNTPVQPNGSNGILA